MASDTARRADIVAATQASLIALGYAGTTMDGVAARCHISKQTLYRLFPSKTHLFREVVVAHRRTMLALPVAGDDLPLEAALAAIFRIDIGPEAERERAAFIRMAMMESQEFPEIARLLHEHGFRYALDLLAEWLAGRARRGEIVLDDPASGARLLMDMIFGAMRPAPPQCTDWAGREDRTAHIRRCIAIFARGVTR